MEELIKRAQNNSDNSQVEDNYLELDEVSVDMLVTIVEAIDSL